MGNIVGKKTKILVTGEGGFIGKAIIKELLKQGHAVNAFDLAPLNQEFFSHPQCQTIQGNLLDSETVAKAVSGCKAVIHLASVLGNPDYQKNYQVHVLGTKNLLAACTAQKVKRIIAYSTIAATRDNPGAYGATKKEMEELLLSPQAREIAVTIFRPTMVLGYGGKGLSTIIKQVQAYPLLIPLIGSGKTRRQPILLQDLVRATILALENPKTFGKNYTLAGPEILAFRELLLQVKKVLGVKKKIIPVPRLVALTLAHCLEMVSSRPAFTVENVRNSTLPESAESLPIYQDCSFQPTPLSQVLPEIIRQYHQQTQKEQEPS